MGKQAPPANIAIGRAAQQCPRRFAVAAFTAAASAIDVAEALQLCGSYGTRLSEFDLRNVASVRDYVVRYILVSLIFFTFLAPLSRCSVPDQNSSELAATLYSLVAAGVVLRPAAGPDCPDDLADEGGCGIPEGDD